MNRKQAAKTLLAALLIWAAEGSMASSNVDPSLRYAWGENVGWSNARPAKGGITATPHLLSGYGWGENVGWINFGDGTPDSGDFYSNTSNTDFGVNLDGEGHLTGYAWGENIGWIKFGTVQGGEVILTPAGVFSGYAWGENIGWITMGAAYGFRLADTDNDEIADAFETGTGIYVSPYDTGTQPGDQDSDDDSLWDSWEHAMGLNPSVTDTDGDGQWDGCVAGNGTFELGHLGWMEWASYGGDPVIEQTADAYTDEWAAVFGYDIPYDSSPSGSLETKEIVENVILPDTGMATLNFALKIEEIIPSLEGVLRVYMDGHIVKAFGAGQTEFADYHDTSFDVSPYADGQPHELRFEAVLKIIIQETGPSGSTVKYYVDDVCFNAFAGNGGEDELLECPEDSLYTQPPGATAGWWSYLSSATPAFRVFDNFDNADGAIGAVTWWGLNVAGTSAPGHWFPPHSSPTM